MPACLSHACTRLFRHAVRRSLNGRSAIATFGNNRTKPMHIEPLSILSNNNTWPMSPNRQQVRCSSQLFPTTSQSIDAVMEQALNVVGDTDSYSLLRQYIRGEFGNIAKYLSKLVGTNHPMLETAKRCSYISEGRMGSAQARGLVVMLVGKALANQSTNDIELLKRQLSLAEMTEMTYSAYMIHRGVMDVRQQVEYQHEFDINQAKGVHYGNKVAILCGDFLLAYVMRGLGDLYNSQIVDCISTAITEFMEGEFWLIEDHETRDYFRTSYATNIDRWTTRAFASIGSLQANSCQAAALLVNSSLANNRSAYEFGKNLGLAWQAHTELQPFLKSIYEPVELPELPTYPAFDLNCLPVLLHVRELTKSSSTDQQQNKLELFIQNINYNRHNSYEASRQTVENVAMNQHSHIDRVDYEKLHSIIVADGRAIQATQEIIGNYTKLAIKNLDAFPQNEARDVLENICFTLNKLDHVC